MNKRKLHSPFIDNIWDPDLADTQLISKFNKGFRILLCVIDVNRKYMWVIPLKDKKGIEITDAFQKILDKSNCKPNKIWVDKGSEFYNISMKSWLQKIIQKSIPYTMKENLLLLKDSLEPQRIKFIKSWFKINSTEKYSIHNEGKSVVAEIFIRTSKDL